MGDQAEKCHRCGQKMALLRRPWAGTGYRRRSRRQAVGSVLGWMAEPQPPQLPRAARSRVTEALRPPRGFPGVGVRIETVQRAESDQRRCAG